MLDSEDIKFFLGSGLGTYGTAALLCVLAPATISTFTIGALTFAAGTAGGSLASNRPREIYNNIVQSFFRPAPNTCTIDKVKFLRTAKLVLLEKLDVDEIDNELIDKMKHHLTIPGAPYKNEAILLLSAILTMDKNFSIDPDLSRTPIQLRRNNFLYLERFNLKNADDVSTVLVDAIRTIEKDKGFRLQNDPVFEEIFTESYEIPEIRPLLKIAALAAHGLHDLANVNKGTAPAKLKIIIDPDRDDTHAISFGSDKNTHGTYRRNLIYLGGKRSDDKLLSGTLIHELTHFIADEVFKNGCNPYQREDTNMQQEFERICRLLRQRKNNIHSVLNAVFSQRRTIILASDSDARNIKEIFSDDEDIIITSKNNSYTIYYIEVRDNVKKLFQCTIVNRKLIGLLKRKPFDDKVCDDNDIEDEVDSILVRFTKKTIFTYAKSDWHCELIARVPHLIAMSDTDDPYKDIESDCPELLAFYRDNFLPACKSHIKAIIERHAKTELNATDICVVNKKIP